MRIDQLFSVMYGNKFDFNKMIADPDGVAFVGRSGSRQGVSGYVRELEGVTPFAAGLLTVALGGASRLATFVQSAPFYTAQNVAVLTPKTSMSLEEKICWAMYIKANRYRYEGFGREANRTLASLELPDAVAIPLAASPVAEALISQVPALSAGPEAVVRCGGTVSELFDIRYGQSLELNRLTRVDPPTGVNFVSRTDRLNGVSARVTVDATVPLGRPGELSVALGGSPLATFLQPEHFVCGRDVAILTPRIEMTDAEKLYWAMCIRANRYRFSYGRQANRTLGSLKLPSMPADWVTKTRVSSVLDEVRSGLQNTATSLGTQEVAN